MEQEYGVIAIGGICLIVLLMGVIKERARMVAVFLSRAVVGIAGVCLINQLLAAQGIDVAVGVNPVSVLTIGTLGISGVALLYGIMLYRLL